MKFAKLSISMIVLSLALTVTPSSLFAQFTVSGRVEDPNNQGVYPVNIDVEDSETGDPIPIWGDSTHVSGYYAFSLPTGIYDIMYIPDPITGVAPVIEHDVIIESSIILNVTAPWGYEVSGIVTDQGSNPVYNADIDVVDSFTNEALLTPNDNTDPTGFYSVLVPEGVFNFTYTPRPEDSLATLTLWEVQVLSDMTLDATMPLSVRLSGRVKNEGGSGIFNVDIDVDDALTGRRIQTTDDNTDENGFYSIIVPVGFLDIMYEAPIGSGYADNAIWDLVVNRDLNLNVELKNGWEISGTVTISQGQGVPNVDLDVDNSITGERLHTSHDNTDLTGNYSIMVPTGTYDILFEPPEGLPLVARRIESRVINGNTVINQTLPVGNSLSGTISDDDGMPVDNCDVDVIDVNTGNTIPTPRDNSDEQGNYQVYIPLGTYDLVYQPVPESGVGEDSILGVVVTQNIIRNINLPFLFNQAVALDPGGVSIFPGDQLFETIRLFNNDTQSRRVQVMLDAFLPSGGSISILPPFPPNGLNLPAGRQVRGVLPIDVPPLAPVNLEVKLKGFILDFNQGSTLNADSTVVKILDPANPAGRPIIGSKD
jgi:hypothetical protein